MDDEFVDQISGQAELEAEAERIEREEAEREGLITEAIEDGGAPKPCRFVSDINWKDVGMPFPMGLWKRSRDIVAKIKEGGEASEAELNTLRKFTDIKIQLMKRQEIDPIKWGWSLKGAELIKKYLPIAKVLLVGGGQRCLGGNTLIYDPIRQQSQKVQDILVCLRNSQAMN